MGQEPHCLKQLLLQGCKSDHHRPVRWGESASVAEGGLLNHLRHIGYSVYKRSMGG